MLILFCQILIYEQDYTFYVKVTNAKELRLLVWSNEHCVPVQPLYTNMYVLHCLVLKCCGLADIVRCGMYDNTLVDTVFRGLKLYNKFN